ncbi:MAG: galactose-1-phosphate uridylyltransferase [Planctomycetes bacterium]|nr:galactose-1-phosphate uridylyltransferase [Planctomycetota bacterium]
MSELRFDPFKGRWVNVSPHRAARPLHLVGDRDSCPFCPGNEHDTPPEVLAIRPPDGPADGPGWTLRVVPNRFPALTPAAHDVRRSMGVFAMMAGVGHHEVLIETPDHEADLDDLPAAQMARVLRVLWRLVGEHERAPETAYVLAFRNWGRAAGASVAHPHTQILALPVVPAAIAREVTNSVAYLRRTGRPLAEDMLREEIADGARRVAENDRFVVLVPFAAAFPFEMALYPRQPAARFAELTEAEVSPLGELLQDVLRRMKRVLNGPAYNIVLHTAPNPIAPATAALADPDEIEAAFHWHLEIVPRPERTDGFEWATGLYVCTLAPEEAARQLRENSPP